MRVIRGKTAVISRRERQCFDPIDQTFIATLDAHHLDAQIHALPHDSAYPIDWAWLDRQTVVAETGHVRHVRLEQPLAVRADGRKGWGTILP